MGGARPLRKSMPLSQASNEDGFEPVQVPAGARVQLQPGGGSFTMQLQSLSHKSSFNSEANSFDRAALLSSPDDSEEDDDGAQTQAVEHLLRSGLVAAPSNDGTAKQKHSPTQQAFEIDFPADVGGLEEPDGTAPEVIGTAFNVRSDESVKQTVGAKRTAGATCDSQSSSHSQERQSASHIKMRKGNQRAKDASSPSIKPVGGPTREEVRAKILSPNMLTI